MNGDIALSLVAKEANLSLRGKKKERERAMPVKLSSYYFEMHMKKLLNKLAAIYLEVSRVSSAKLMDLCYQLL